MAKKVKKRSISSGTTAAVTTISTPRNRQAGSSEFNPDYSYVKKDLTRIGILAGSFFIVLVVLSFFLR